MIGKPRNVAILVFAEVEVLDFAGPFEVFGVTRALGEAPFNVYTVAASAEPVRARNGLLVVPNYTLDNAPPADIVLIPGGRGTRQLVVEPAILDWVRQQAAEVELMLSVCTGALVLGAAGVLAGLRATTYHTAFDELAALSPDSVLEPGSRWVDNGTVVTSAGVSAGIDMALYVVGRLHGVDVARSTAAYMEYRWDELRVMSDE